MTRQLKKLIQVPVLLLAFCLAMPNAMAEDQVDVGATVSLNLMTSSSTTSSVGISAFFVFFEVATSSSQSVSSITNTALAPIAATETYINNNAVALQSDITVGGGQSIDDLARMCSIPTNDTAAFGKLLQKHRKQLVPMLSKKADRAKTLKFLKTIERGMKQDKQLKGLVASR